MNLLNELTQKVEYDNREISIIELFIIDSKYFYCHLHLYRINQVTKLFLISHEADLVFAYYTTVEPEQKNEKISKIIDNFIHSYNLLITSGFTFQTILKYTYLEFYDISSVIDDIRHKKYFWRRIVNKASTQILADLNDQIIYFLKEKNKYTFKKNMTVTNIPDYFFKYVNQYIERTHRITHKKIIISGMKYNNTSTYIYQQKKYEEWKKKREEQLKYVENIKNRQESKIQIVEEKTETLTYIPAKSIPPVTEIKEHKLDYNDFIIRCSIFKCSFRQHEIIDIDASIDIMNINTNNIISMIISAGYCSNCNKYFIMDSTYHKIFSKGLPLCKIVDERELAYKGVVSVPALNKWGAQESILKQYGYNVSAITNLSDTKRQKILAVIIDIEALTKVEIIGYLRYFIRIHKTDSRFEKAISKWSNDIEFTEEYNKGHYTTYKVSGLKKKW